MQFARRLVLVASIGLFAACGGNAYLPTSPAAENVCSAAEAFILSIKNLDGLEPGSTTVELLKTSFGQVLLAWTRLRDMAGQAADAGKAKVEGSVNALGQTINSLDEGSAGSVAATIQSEIDTLTTDTGSVKAALGCPGA